MSRYGNNIIKVKWRDKKDLQFLTGIRFYGHDKFGMIKEIINILTAELEINIRSFKLDTNNDLFEGQTTIYVSHSKQLNDIIQKLQKIEGMDKIYRIE
jgi:GTP pyrophosphokinase